MEQNNPDRNLDHNLDQEKFVWCKHSIWIMIWIILIQILGGLQCDNEWTINNIVMRFVVLNNICPV